MKTHILLISVLLTLVHGPFAYGADFFSLKCSGENNNSNDATLTLTAEIDVEDRWTRDDGEGKGARWIRVTKARFSNVYFYNNRESKIQGNKPSLILNSFESSGSYVSKLSDENENGILDSILRTFDYSVTLDDTNFNISATNIGQGGKNNYVLSIYSNSEIGTSASKMAWTYCKLKRRWF